MLRTPVPDETILGLLAFRPQHGYDLLEHFRDPARLGEVWNLSISQLYAVLKRLESEHWIAGRQIPSENSPTRTEYRLTPAGRAKLDAWLAEEHPSSSIRRVRVEFLSRLYVAWLLRIPAEPIIRRQSEICARRRVELAAQREQMQPGVGSLALDLVIAQLDAVLAWIGHCSSTVARIEKR